jgi:putative transcriptional regulator
VINSNLKAILDSRGLSIRKVSNDIDYRFETIRRMYNNDLQHYPKDLIDRLCSYLEIGVEDLLEYKKEDTEK